MIRFTQGDILDCQAEALVNTVNCVGVMGRGIALQFKQAYPANFKAYAAACQHGEVQPGRMFVYETGALSRPRYIINFPTKRHWRGKSRIEDIRDGLDALVLELRARRVTSVAIPPLGSGLGGLDWGDVRPLIEQALAELPDIDATVFEPSSQPTDHRANRSSEVPAMTPGRAALVVLMNRYLAALMDPTITLLEVHKLTYFLQAAGQPMRLHFNKASHGPYAENLRHVLRAIEGHLVSGYADGGDAPGKQLTLIVGAVRDAEAYIADDPDIRGHFDRVACLIDGFETPFGLELLSTVHWVVCREHATRDDEIERAVRAWGPQKQVFTSTQIAIATERLRSEGWLAAA